MYKIFKHATAKVPLRAFHVCVTLCMVAAVCAFGVRTIAYAAAPSSAIGFQGQLRNGGSAVNESVSATFGFYDALSGGSQQGSTISKTVQVSDGYFSIAFDDSDVSGIDFNQALWIEVSINGNVLTPRSAITSVPSAKKAFGAFSFGSAPTVGPAGSLYYDSGTGSLMVSNGASWVTVGSSAGSTLSIGNGFLHTATSTDGMKAAYFAATSTTATSTFAGAVGIGTTNPESTLHVSGTGANAIIVERYTDGVAANEFVSRKSRGVESAKTAVQTADQLGGVEMHGWDGSSWQVSSAIRSIVNGSVSAGSLPADLVFYTNPNISLSERLRITAGGNVGIGSTTPSARLTVTGSGTGTSKAFVVTNSSNAEKVIVLDNGNVGIGVSPTQALDVNGNIYGRSVLYSRDIRGSSTDGNLSLRGSDRHDSTQILIQGLSNGSDMQFLTDTTGAVNTATVQMVLKSSGNLGIGSTTPSGKLVVQNAGSGNSFVVEDQSGDTTPFVIDASGNIGIGTTTPTQKLVSVGDASYYALMLDNSSSNGSTNKWRISPTGSAWGAGDNKLVFTYEDTTSANSKFTIDGSTGYVGIGTTSPSQMLSVSGNGYFTGNLGLGISGSSANFALHTTSGAASYFHITNTDTGTAVGDGFLIGMTSSEQAYLMNRENTDFYIGTNNLERMRITADGSIGIGTTTPTSLLSLSHASAPEISIYNETSLKNWRIGSGVGSGAANTTFGIADGSTSRFVIDGSGNVGFGSTTPGSTLSGPLTGTFSIAASSPVQGASSASGNALTIRAANATRGSVSGAGAGGSLSLTAGHATSISSGSASGGSITLTAGNQASSEANAAGQGGNITLLAGAGASSNYGAGGSVIITAGSGTAAFAGQGGSITLTSGDSADGGAGSIKTGAITIKSADTSGASTGDVLLAVGDTSSNTRGPGTLTIRGGRSNYTASNPIASGLVQIVTQQGGSNNSSSGSGTGGGSQLFTLGAGGNASGNTSATGGTGGGWTVAGAVGGNATGSGGTQLGGNGSALSLTSGAGGNATGASGTRTGGNGGNIAILTGAGGTGATANGTAGVLSLGVGGVTQFRISATGNIGIGTTSPSAKLDVWGDLKVGTSTAGVLYANSATGMVGIGNASSQSKLSVGAVSTTLSTWAGSDSLLVSTNVSGSAIGIASENRNGTDGSFAGLYRNTGAAMSASNRLGGFLMGGSSNASTLQNSVLIAAFAEENWVHGSAYGSYLTFETVSNGAASRTEKMRLSADGNLGIGTTTPGQKLVVGGNAQFTGVLSGTKAFDLNLTEEGVLTTSASDARLKENLEAIEASSTLGKIMDLRPYTFSWISDPSHARDVGLIAQDVEKVFPELVFTNRTDGYKGVNYSKLPALLIAGMQAQQLRIDELTRELKAFGSFMRTKELHTEKLCIGTEDDEVCITKEELRNMVQGSKNVPVAVPVPQAAHGENPVSESAPVPVPEAVVPEGESAETGSDSGTPAGTNDPADPAQQSESNQVTSPSVVIDQAPADPVPVAVPAVPTPQESSAAPSADASQSSE